MTDIASAAREAETVRKATADELRALASVLARAFLDDPVFSWMLPDESRRLETQERAFELWLRKLFFDQGESYTTDGVAGAAIWELPANGRSARPNSFGCFPRWRASSAAGCRAPCAR